MRRARREKGLWGDALYVFAKAPCIQNEIILSAVIDLLREFPCQPTSAVSMPTGLWSKIIAHESGWIVAQRQGGFLHERHTGKQETHTLVLFSHVCRLWCWESSKHFVLTGAPLYMVCTDIIPHPAPRPTHAAAWFFRNFSRTAVKTNNPLTKWLSYRFYIDTRFGSMSNFSIFRAFDYFSLWLRVFPTESLLSKYPQWFLRRWHLVCSSFSWWWVFLSEGAFRGRISCLSST